MEKAEKRVKFMPKSYLQTVILYCLHQIKGDRSIYSIFHIIKGKKSSQTIQDVHLFQIAPFFQSFDFIKREEFEQIIAHLVSIKWLKQERELHYQLTKLGKASLDMQIIERPFPVFLNGLTYQSLTGPFWERLSLLVQVCSNLVHNQSHYIPIQRKYEIQIWLKNFLAQLSNSRNELSLQLFTELTQLLEREQTINPSTLVLRLTGHNQIGLTPQQVALYLEQEFTYYHVQFLNVLHYLLKMVEQETEQYPLLFSIIKDLHQRFPFTNSTKKTYEMLRSGVSLEEITQIRKLKRSTIEDHLVEIAFNDKQFNITPYVPLKIQELILKTVKQNGSKQLKHIRELTNGLEYFEIRLVLAKFGERT
jgi:uncharacterized protein YpbB